MLHQFLLILDLIAILSKKHTCKFGNITCVVSGQPRQLSSTADVLAINRQQWPVRFTLKNIDPETDLTKALLFQHDMLKSCVLMVRDGSEMLADDGDEG